MKCKLEVVRFRSEDVIATSGLLRKCEDYGIHYIYTSVEYEDHYETVPNVGRVGLTAVYLAGEEFNYTADAGLVKRRDFTMGFTIDPGARLSIQLGPLYHYDGGKWPYALCVPQDH